ncbi:hypothetical protein D3C87_947200 [compost metagenome]
MAKQPSTELDVDAVRRVAEDVAAQPVQERLEDNDHQQTNDEHVQRGHAAMHQHLVHHDLEEQRADQCEELEDEGDEEHLAQQLAMLDEAGNEPGEVELGEFACKGGAAGDEDEFTGPVRGEDVQGFDDGARRFCGRVLQQHALGVALSKDDEALAAILRTKYRQSGQRRQGQAIRRGAGGLGLEAQMLGCAQQRSGINRLGGCQAELMRKQGRIGCDLVEARDSAQRDKRRVRNDPCFRGLLRRRTILPVLLHDHLPDAHLGSSIFFFETSRYLIGR